MSARLLIADDHPLFRRGLREVVEQLGHEVVAEAGDGEAALAAIAGSRPDVAVVDLRMPGLDGLELMAKAQDLPRAPRFVVMTMHDDPAYVKHALGLGARGYLLKESADRELAACLEEVLRGGRYLPPSLRGAMPAAAEGSETLTAAEQRILQLVAEGHSSKAIARLLDLSQRTIDNHRAHIAAKLGLQGSHALLRYALKERSGP